MSKRTCGHGTTQMECPECQAAFYRSAAPTAPRERETAMSALDQQVADMTNEVADWLATEDGKRAVEAMRKMWPYPYAFDETVPPMLTTALPHLDRLFRERYAAALEAEVSGDLDKVPRRPGESVSDKWYYYRECAAFLRREPTL